MDRDKKACLRTRIPGQRRSRLSRVATFVIDSLIASNTVTYTRKPTAPSDISRGKTLAIENKSGMAACLTCHGARSAGDAESGYSCLTGLITAYLHHQIDSFKHSMCAIMQSLAPLFTELEIEIARLTDWFAGRSALDQSTAPKLDPQRRTRGHMSAVRGDCYKNVSSHINCHGPRVASVVTIMLALWARLGDSAKWDRTAIVILALSLLILIVAGLQYTDLTTVPWGSWEHSELGYLPR